MKPLHQAASSSGSDEPMKLFAQNQKGVVRHKSQGELQG
jgi:hypothetical protein